jgi:hypothetical protein
MRLPDLPPTTQVGLRIAIAILATIFLIRVVTFFRRQYAHTPHRYPSSWSTEQATTFERIRVLIGIALALTWAIFKLAAPQMPQSWPFGLAEMSFTIGLLAMTNAWCLLIIPSDWEHTVASRVSFGTSMSILVGWWIATLGALLAMIIWVARPVQFHFQFPMGPFAQHENITGAVASPQPTIQRFVLERGPSIALVRVSFRTELNIGVTTVRPAA